MYSKRVTRRSELAAGIAAAAEQFSASSGEFFEARLAPYLREGEKMPDVVLFQELLGRLVADQGSRLTAVDEVLQASLRGARSLRWKRNDEAEALRDLLVAARFYFDQVSGRGTGARLGIGHGLSRMVPRDLCRVAFLVAESLLIEKPRKKRRASAAVLPDPAVLSAAIREQSAKVKAAVDELSPQNAGTIFARGNQMRNLEATEKLVRRSAGLLAEIYKYCDRPDLAANVRPVFRRKPRAKRKSEDAPDADWSDIRHAEDLEPAAPAAEEPERRKQGFWGLSRRRRGRRRLDD